MVPQILRARGERGMGSVGTDKKTGDLISRLKVNHITDNVLWNFHFLQFYLYILFIKQYQKISFGNLRFREFLWESIFRFTI